MKTIYAGIVILFLFVSSSVMGQTALNIGDKVPNAVLTNVRNHISKTLAVSDFKGKLIIIDFWNKFCAPCISAFPKMEELQNKYKGKIQILLVTNNTDEELNGLFKSSEIIKNIKLPIITGDSILHSYFPHSGVPYHIWIDKEGKLYARLNGFHTNSASIEDYLTFGKNNFLIKGPDIFSHEQKYGPLIQQIKGVGFDQTSQVYAYTLLTKRNVYNTAAMQVVDTASRRMMNFTIISLIRSTYSLIYPSKGVSVYSSDQIGKLNPLKIVFEPRTTETLKRFFYPSRNSPGYGTWIDNNTYCYETVFEPDIMKLPSAIRRAKQDSLVINDLERYFGIKTNIKNGVGKCMILYRKSAIDLLRTKGGEEIYEKTEDGILRIRNGRINLMSSVVSGYFTAYAGEYPFIDETGYEGNIDIDFPVNVSLQELNSALDKYGLGIKMESRPIRLLTITEI